MGRLLQIGNQILAFFLNLPPARRVTVAVVGAGSLALVLLGAWFVQRPVYRPLFTNLSTEDASAIVEALKAEKVDFQIEDGGRAVSVPAEKLYELRLSLASRGLPEGGGVGFEIFDKQSLGQTDFLQHLNYQRALQGELARTISKLGGVESARVHLAIPERSLFVGQERRSSASVVVKLVSGRTLARSQIDGIVHLVAASVEGLDAEAVTVVDEGGRILTSEHRNDATGASSSALEYQQALERQIGERVETMLAAAVGRDKAIARVAATIDFARVERTEETYDPDKTALKTQHTTREQSAGAKTGGGAPGVQANITNEAAGAGAGGGNEGPKSDRRDETQNYEVSKVISRTIGAAGTVKQLSVAVVIDGTYADQGGKKVFTPRPPEELDRLKELVKSAVGFSEERGDKVEMASVQFQTEELPAGEGFLGPVMRWAPSIFFKLLALVIVVGGVFYTLPLIARALATPGGALGPRLSGPQAALALTQENQALTQQNPERAAQLVREWLHESGSGESAG
jgi:flagellar M-ring protein FliF